MQKKRQIIVETYVDEQLEDLLSERTVDLGDKFARDWFHKHMFWAVLNGFTVCAIPMQGVQHA